MRRPHTEVYIHLVWATFDRMPVLRGEIEAAAYASICSECAGLAVEIIALGGVEDHVHLLVRLPMTLSIADLAKQVKGASSHMLTHQCGFEGFRWQGAYGAFSVEKKSVPRVRSYIESQKEHHAAGTVWDTLERVFEEN